VEAAAAPIARVGALASRIESDVEAARAHYREGLLNASHLVGWAAGAFLQVQELLARKQDAGSPPGPSPAAPDPPAEPALAGAAAVPSSQGDFP
jgi:hypothetical protein